MNFKPLPGSASLLHRRRWLRRMGAVTASGLLGASTMSSLAVDSSYRALVVIHLNGGNDGNNTLIPTDGEYATYQEARQNLALPLRSLVQLSGSVDGRTLAFIPVWPHWRLFMRNGDSPFLRTLAP